jgi:hypothetical protein
LTITRSPSGFKLVAIFEAVLSSPQCSERQTGCLKAR